jgi:hypothetical protein
VPEISTLVSLTVVATVLAATTVTSMRASRNRLDNESEESDGKQRNVSASASGSTDYSASARAK